MWSLIQECWDKEAARRPTAASLVRTLSKLKSSLTYDEPEQDIKSVIESDFKPLDLGLTLDDGGSLIDPETYTNWLEWPDESSSAKTHSVDARTLGGEPPSRQHSRVY